MKILLQLTRLFQVLFDMKIVIVVGLFAGILTNAHGQRGGGPKNAAPLAIEGERLPELVAHDETGEPFPLTKRLKGKHGVIVFGCLT